MFLAFLIVAALCVVSWLVTCGIVYLIALCFGFTFTWAVATGVWLILLLLSSITNKGK